MRQPRGEAAASTDESAATRHSSESTSLPAFALPALAWLGMPALGFIHGIHPSVVWLVGGAVGLILEMLVPAFVIGSFGLSALFAALAAWLGAPTGVQIAIFLVLGFAFVVPARRFLHRSRRTQRRGSRALPGRPALCIEPIDGDLMAGVVELDQTRWTAITIRGAQIARGATVEVVAVEGARLLVAEKPQGASKP